MLARWESALCIAVVALAGATSAMAAPTAPPVTTVPPAASVLDALRARPELRNITRLIMKTDDLAKSLGGDDGTNAKYTLFAPTDAAFANLSASLTFDVVRVLCEGANADLRRRKVLYHVANSTVLSTDLKKSMDYPREAVETLLTDPSGVQWWIDWELHHEDTPTGWQLRADRAKVTTADVLAHNGVVQILDSVLWDPSQ